MATLITLVKFTDQGIRTINESPDRFEAFRAMAENFSITVRSVHYTIGQYDMILVLEGSEDAATTLLLKVASLGNVRTQTMRGYSVDEMRLAIGQMP